MINIKDIIGIHRSKLEAAGLLKPVGTNQVSAKVKAMRPSLNKVGSALEENPQRFMLVQASPLSLLFDVTLARLEPLLVEVGRVRAEKIIGQLCDHSQQMIEKHGLDGSRPYLEELYKHLLLVEATLRGPDGAAEFISAYFSLSFERQSEKYLRIVLAEKIEELKFDEQGKIRLELTNEGTDRDLQLISKVPLIVGLSLGGTKVTDIGLSYLPSLTDLQQLDLAGTRITDAGLAGLSSLAALRNLNLKGDRITNAGLFHLRTLNNLHSLDLAETGITDAGLAHITGFADLQSLTLNETRITDGGIEHLIKLVNLEYLYIHGVKISSDVGVGRLKEALPDLTVQPDFSRD